VLCLEAGTVMGWNAGRRGMGGDAGAASVQADIRALAVLILFRSCLDAYVSISIHVCWSRLGWSRRDNTETKT